MMNFKTNCHSKEDNMKFDNDKYCKLIGEYSNLCKEIGKLKKEKELVEKEMHRMVYEFGVDCENGENK